MDFILPVLLMFSYYHLHLFLIMGIDGYVNHSYSDLTKKQLLSFFSYAGRGYRWSRCLKLQAWAQGKPLISNYVFGKTVERSC